MPCFLEVPYRDISPPRNFLPFTFGNLPDFWVRVGRRRWLRRFRSRRGVAATKAHLDGWDPGWEHWKPAGVCMSSVLFHNSYLFIFKNL
jgi:hypothetical protein